MLYNFLAPLSFGHIGAFAALALAIGELAAICYAISAVSRAPKGRCLNVLRATYLWRSQIFSDSWKARNKVPNIPLKSSAQLLCVGIFVGLGYFGFGTMQEAFGLSALCAISFIGVSHIMLMDVAPAYQKAYIRARKIQTRLESLA